MDVRSRDDKDEGRAAEQPVAGGRVTRRRINIAVAAQVVGGMMVIATVLFFVIRTEIQQKVRIEKVRRYVELIDAVKSGDIPTVTHLLGRGVPLRQEPFGSVLSIAATDADLSMVRALIDLGADVTWKDAGGNTALAYADRAGRMEVSDLLAKALAEASPFGGPIQRLWEGGIPFTARAFIAAAADNDIETVALFLDAGMSVDAEGAKGATALSAAARSGNPEVVRLLLERGASMTAAQSALTTAAALGRHSVVVVLIEAGLDPDGREESWNALLHSLDNPRIRKYLVDSGASVDHPQDEYRHTALHIAISPRVVSPFAGATLQQRRDWVRFLIDSGADVNKRSSNDLRPLDLARIEGDPVMIRWLEEAGAVGRAR